MRLLTCLFSRHQAVTHVVMSVLVPVFTFPLSRLTVDGLMFCYYILIFYKFFFFYVNIFTMAMQRLCNDKILDLLSNSTVSKFQISDQESNDNFHK